MNLPFQNERGKKMSIPTRYELSVDSWRDCPHYGALSSPSAQNTAEGSNLFLTIEACSWNTKKTWERMALWGMYMPWLSTSVKVWQSTFFCLDTHDWTLKHVQFAPSNLTFVFFYFILISVTWGLPCSFALPDREFGWFWQFTFFFVICSPFCTGETKQSSIQIQWWHYWPLF